jgi:ribosomal protein S18 acetylase RimI-like enzyme
MDREIVIRPAVSADAATIAEVIAMAIGDEAGLRNYCGEEYMAVLTEVARREATQYSWQNALIAELNSVVAGAVVGYDGAQLYTLREGTFATINEFVERTQTIVDETSAGEYYLDSVGVLPQYRGLGIGRALVEAFCSKVFAEGHNCVGLIVDFENPNAEKLYTSVGFKRINTRPFFNHQMWHLQREHR